MKIAEKISKSVNALAVLIDPDKVSENRLGKVVDYANKGYIDFLFAGGSFATNSTDKLVKFLKNSTNVPVVLFPGHPSQVSYEADAILFLSLISGRNPEFLIGHHIYVANELKNSKLEVLPTGYILVESGRTTTVEYISNTKPIPPNKTDLIVSTAIAGELMGLKFIYLEAGSGADNHLNIKMLNIVKKSIDIPLIVGGGIKNANDLKEIASVGANVIVVGTAFEKSPSLIPEFSKILKNAKNR